MQLVFCSPDLTMNNTTESTVFFNYCKEALEKYLTDVCFVSNEFMVNQILSSDIDQKCILAFFNNEKREYSRIILELINAFKKNQCRIWPIAMEKDSLCRQPPLCIAERQSFDVSCRKENRNPLNNNTNAIAQILVRKIISQVLSPLYHDEVLYFISHKRIDGERITASIADKLKLLTRERNIYRDVVNVEVGDDAQNDIDENLKKSDVLIFIQTPLASESEYISKELCYALINNIPILWINIDDADFTKLKIKPGDKPLLFYSSEDFYDESKIEQIADTIEEKCFQLMMNSSNQLFSYLQVLYDFEKHNTISLEKNKEQPFSYFVTYVIKSDDWLKPTIQQKHFIQCFGRNPRDDDWRLFIKRANSYSGKRVSDSFLLSNKPIDCSKRTEDHIREMSFDDYLYNFERKTDCYRFKNKRIIISGAFPDGNGIYQNSLIEALLVYSCEIIKNGYTLVFGAHPTFQEPIFEIGRRYSPDVKKSVEMHMSKEFLNLYNEEELEYLKGNCTLHLSDTIDAMREKMIANQEAIAMICIGGKIKDDKAQQGLDSEIRLARKRLIPVVLIGTVGGRSSEMAYEIMSNSSWNRLNDFDQEINKEFYNTVNHKMMAKKLIKLL